MRCVNPGSRYCDCAVCLKDRNTVSNARNRVTYGNNKNPIVEWTLSDGWTQPSSMLLANTRMRGSVRTGNVVQPLEVVAGEIPEMDDSLGFRATLREIDQRPWSEVDR